MSPIKPVLSSLRWASASSVKFDELSWRQREIIELQREKRGEESLDCLPTHQRVLEAPDRVQTKAGRVRNRPVPINLRNNKTTSFGKSDQVSTNCEEPFRRVLNNRKKADPNLAKVL